MQYQFNSSPFLLVVGDVMLDRYWHGPTLRTSPEAPVSIVNVNRVEERPGGAANVALNLSTLGGQPCLMGLTGADEAADTLHQLLISRGVQAHFYPQQQWQTTVKLRVLSQQQQLIRLDFEQPYRGVLDEGLLANYQHTLSQADGVILSDYGKGTLNEVQTLICRARKENKPIYVDPHGLEFTRYRGATLLTMSLRELSAAVGSALLDNRQISEHGHILMKNLELEAILITRGAQGMTLLRQGKADTHLPSRSGDVYDVTGASDTVIAAMSLGLAGGYSFEEAMNFANTAAGIVVGKSGTATVSLEELNTALRQELSVSALGAMARKELKIVIKAAQARGEKVVFTNGCFDLLHAGHVAFLQAAKRQGDRLVVAINDDDSVRRLKGELRPIFNVEARLELLSALEAVDWVIAFSEDTPEALLSELQPDILVKGGDYALEGVVGAQIVHAYGGKVQVIEHDFADYSTTKVLEKVGALNNMGSKP